MFVLFSSLQKQRNILPSTVDGKDYENISTATGDEWKRRRSVLSPAFSTHKMKLVCVHDYSWDLVLNPAIFLIQ